MAHDCSGLEVGLGTGLATIAFALTSAAMPRPAPAMVPVYVRDRRAEADLLDEVEDLRIRLAATEESAACWRAAAVTAARERDTLAAFISDARRRAASA